MTNGLPLEQLPAVAPAVPPQRLWRRWWIWLIVLMALPFLVFTAYVIWLIPRVSEEVGRLDRFTNAPGMAVGQPTGGGDLIRPWSPTLGSPTAKLTIIEFGDFECPYCQSSFPVIRSIVAAYPDHIRFVYRHFPITAIHTNAVGAAEASACAAAEGKFWPYHDRLFQRRQFDPASRRRYAVESGLDVDRFDNCVATRQFKNEIVQDLNDGQALGVRGTPTWFINGRRVEGEIPEQVFRDVVSRLLGESR